MIVKNMPRPNVWIISVVVVISFASTTSAETSDDEPRIIESPLTRLNDELSGPERTYDHQAWRAVEVPSSAPEEHFHEANENWRTEEVRPDPPRRRRPGRKRKRRPHTTPPSTEYDSVQDGVRFDGGIQVVYDSTEGERPRPRRPVRIQEDQHWRGEAVNANRPHRKRGHRRRQRPYLPDLNFQPSANEEPNYPVKINKNLHAEPEDTQIKVVTEDHSTPPSGEEVIHIHDENEQPIRPQIDDLELTTINAHNEEEVQYRQKPQADKEAVHNDKSYRRLYSQAKKQDAEEIAMMGGSADLKALLKQSGGLSLSEILQQRNISLTDLLTGKQHALSALRPAENDNDGFVPIKNPTETSSSDTESIDEKPKYGTNTENKRRRLPAVNKDGQQRRINANNGERVKNNQQNNRAEAKRRLPPTNVYRRQQTVNPKENDVEIKEVVTEKSAFIPSHPRKSENENIIKKNEQNSEEITTDVSLNTRNKIEEDTVITTQEVPTTTVARKDRKEEIRSRLSLKPRLRLPAVKHIPKRISNPNRHKDDKSEQPKPEIESVAQNIIPKTAPIPNQAIPISIKDIFGMSDVVLAAKNLAKAKSNQRDNIAVASTTRLPIIASSYSTSGYKTMRRTTSRTTTTTTTTTTTQKPNVLPPRISAKDEILEILTDRRGGEKLHKILAERNMTLKELVEHRERGSSQLHLADIFQNASRDPDPFLAKSLIEPISKEIYPLKALLEANTRETTSKPVTKQIMSTNPEPPPMFMDISKSIQNEESLGIVTLFDKFADLIGNPAIIDPKDIKKDSDGSSYYTSVINVKPTDEIYRESRNDQGFKNSHKQMSEIFSSIPTYIKTDEIIDAKVVEDHNVQQHDNGRHKNHIPIHHSTYRDMDGDGLIVLDDIQRIEQIDNHIAQASNQQIDDSYINHGIQPKYEQNFYTKLPVGVRSAIIVSSAIVGTSLVVFLTIFIACRWRQKRRNLLRYEDSFDTGIVRSSIMNDRKMSKNNSSSRSISPILVTGETSYRSQKINTMDSQTQREAQEYLWDSLRKPFQ